MLRKIIYWLVLVPLALILLAFAIANRHLVTVSLDPFNSTDPAFALTLPLFGVIIGATIVGVICGGVAAWFGQRHWRHAARKAQAENRDLRSEMQLQRGSERPALPRQP